MKFTYRTALAFALVAAVAAAPSAIAQQYPTKPIRLLIPAPPGGATDILGRLLKEGFTELWGQPVVVDNRGAASGMIAAAATAKANPDGHTLFFTYGGVLTTNLPLFRNIPYHPIKDFAPIAMGAHVPGVLVAHPSFPAKTVQDIIKMAKANPGALTHVAAMIGSSTHLNMELFKQMARIDMLQVSYPGDIPALAALLGNQVPFGFNNVVVTLPLSLEAAMAPARPAAAKPLGKLKPHWKRLRLASTSTQI